MKIIVDREMMLDDIFMMIKYELRRAYAKHQDNEGAWRDNIFEKCAIVACEAGEALQAANKLYYENIGTKENVIDELLQVAATAIRTIIHETHTEG
jgi:NTP pyrophosphatase (non-canonical NTP hydrolase)